MQAEISSGPAVASGSVPTRRVAVLLFDHVDLLDVGGPYEVFLTATRLAVRAGEPAPFEVLTVSVTDRPVRAYGGMVLTPSARLVDALGSEIVVVPGAIEIEAVAADPGVQDVVASLTGSAGVATSVCTGAFLLADAGLLDGRAFTTHTEDLPTLAARLDAPPGHARESPWVDTGTVVTAGGLSSGLAMALHLVDRYLGRDAALATARQLDYAWRPDAGHQVVRGQAGGAGLVDDAPQG